MIGTKNDIKLLIKEFIIIYWNILDPFLSLIAYVLTVAMCSLLASTIASQSKYTIPSIIQKLYSYYTDSVLIILLCGIALYVIVNVFYKAFTKKSKYDVIDNTICVSTSNFMYAAIVLHIIITAVIVVMSQGVFNTLSNAWLIILVVTVIMVSVLYKMLKSIDKIINYVENGNVRA